MEKCYDFFKCKKTECVIQTNNHLVCWDVDEALCDSYNSDLDLLQKLFESKKEYCELCLYYQEHNNEE